MNRKKNLSISSVALQKIKIKEELLIIHLNKNPCKAR